MRLLVTGGAGFIGSNFVRWCLDRSDDEVTVLDALTYAGTTTSLRELEGSPRYRFVRGDVRDAEVVGDVMAGHDAVVHFAAETHVDRSIADGAPFVSTNCVGTQVVMEAATRIGVDKVVHIGTDEVYGSVEVGSSREDDRLEPRSPYSASKAASDLIALSYHATFELPVVVSRCTNNLGPFQHPEKAIPLFVTNLIQGRPIPLYGDGLNERDWLHVADHCEAVRLLVDAGTPGEIYNVGAGNSTPNRVVVDRLLEAFGVGEEMVDHVADRPGHDRRYSVDTTRIRTLGWRRRHDLDSTLVETIAWYRDNAWWWEPLVERASAS